MRLPLRGWNEGSASGPQHPAPVDYHTEQRSDAEAQGLPIPAEPRRKLKRVDLPHRKVLGIVVTACWAPWLVFTIVCVVFTGFYRFLPTLVWCSVCLGAIPLARSAIQHWRRGHTGFFYVSAACLAALLLGSFAGYYNYCMRLDRYWEYENRREYTNVSPDELAAGHMDASAIVFAAGAAPDGTKLGSFHTTSHTYCVAPITIASLEVATEDVQYWAVGVDCCDNFDCPDVTNTSARAGLVLRNSTGLLELTSREMYYFTEAMKTAKGLHSLTSADDLLFLKWCKDISTAREEWWTEAWVWLLWASLAMIVVCLFVGILASFTGFEKLVVQQAY